MVRIRLVVMALESGVKITISLSFSVFYTLHYIVLCMYIGLSHCQSVLCMTVNAVFQAALSIKPEPLKPEGLT